MGGPGWRSWYSDLLQVGRSEDRILVGGRDFPHRSRPALWPTKPAVQCVSFPEVKRTVRGLDNPSPSSAKVEERAKLYLYYPSGPSWPVLQWTLPHYSYISFVVHSPRIYVRKCTLNIKVTPCPVCACPEKRRKYSCNRFAPSVLEGDAWANTVVCHSLGFRGDSFRVLLTCSAIWTAWLVLATPRDCWVLVYKDSNIRSS